jgi:hypothetical protein
MGTGVPSNYFLRDTRTRTLLFILRILYRECSISLHNFLKNKRIVSFFNVKQG